MKKMIEVEASSDGKKATVLILGPIVGGMGPRRCCIDLTLKEATELALRLAEWVGCMESNNGHHHS